MPARTVNDAFLDLHTRLTPTPIETEAAKKHRDSIEACLDSNFGLNKLFRSGSFGNGTSVYGHSDVDYFAWIKYANVPADSAKALTAVRDALDARFPRTGVRVSSPAVRVPFGGGGSQTHEIVVARYAEEKDGIIVYDIPDGSGGWMRSSPLHHNAYVRDVNNKFGEKLKPLVRFAKLWKYLNDVPISSFYLELRITAYAETQSSIIYDMDLKAIFNELIRIDLAKMRDPMGISGLIAPCSTDAKKKEVLSKLGTAYSRAEKAVAARVDDKDDATAFAYWNLIYNSTFPSRYY